MVPDAGNAQLERLAHALMQNGNLKALFWGKKTFSLSEPINICLSTWAAAVGAAAA